MHRCRIFNLWLTAFLALFGAATLLAEEKSMPYAQAYLQALDEFAGVETDPQPVAERFEAMFQDMLTDRLGDHVIGLYAERFYFNDTLKTLSRRDDLVTYLQATSNRVDHINTRTLSVMTDGPDIYVRWWMELRFKAGWRDAHTVTVGISHLRVNADGKIILQQDYWDSAEGIYREMPIIGGLLKGD